jgi:hypothetical protein
MLEDNDPLLVTDAEPQVIDIEIEKVGLYERGRSRNKARVQIKLFMATLLVPLVIVKNILCFKLNLNTGQKPMKILLFAGC